MSELVTDLTLTSAKWNTDTECNKALTEDMENITKATLTDCYCQHGVVKITRDTDIIGGAYHDIRIVSDQGIGSPVIPVGIMGVYIHKLETDSFRSEVTISSNMEGDYTDIHTATIEGVASIGDASICWLTIGPLGHVEIWAGAQIKDLEVFGTAIIHSFHIERIVLHAGGKVKFVNVTCMIESDPYRNTITNKQGWICG